MTYGQVASFKVNGREMLQQEPRDWSATPTRADDCHRRYTATFTMKILRPGKAQLRRMRFRLDHMLRGPRHLRTHPRAEVRRVKRKAERVVREVFASFDYHRVMAAPSAPSEVSDALVQALSTAFPVVSTFPAPWSEEFLLWRTLAWCGERLGVERVPGETSEAYRARLIATGEVTSIEPGNVTLAGKINMVECEFSWGFAEVPQ